MDGAAPGDLPPELAAVQASLLALIAAARCTLDAVEAEPRTFAVGAALVQQAAAVTGPLVVTLATSLFTAGTEPDR